MQGRKWDSREGHLCVPWSHPAGEGDRELGLQYIGMPPDDRFFHVDIYGEQDSALDEAVRSKGDPSPPRAPGCGRGEGGSIDLGGRGGEGDSRQSNKGKERSKRHLRARGLLAKDQDFEGRHSGRFQEGRKEGTRRKGRDGPREEGPSGAVAVPSSTSRGRPGHSVRSQRLTAPARQTPTVAGGLLQLLRPVKPWPAFGEPTGRQLGAPALLMRGGRRRSHRKR